MISYVVVVNTYKRPRELVEKSLRSVLGQKWLPQKLILIDQNSPQLELSSEITQHSLFERQITTENAVSGARNSVKLPKGIEWVCFCDDDGRMAENYSEVLKVSLESNQWDVIAGSVLREDNMDYYSIRHKIGGDLAKFSNLKLLMGSNFVVRAKLFDQLARFDERFGAGTFWGSSEETDFAWKCFFAGARMTFDRELKIIHAPPFNESFKKGFGKSFRYARGKGAMVSKWLFIEHRPAALHELLEMSVVPFIQMIRAVVKLTPSLAINNLGVFVGRWLGMAMFLVKSDRGKKNA